MCSILGVLEQGLGEISKRKNILLRSGKGSKMWRGNDRLHLEGRLLIKEQQMCTKLEKEIRLNKSCSE